MNRLQQKKAGLKKTSLYNQINIFKLTICPAGRTNGIIQNLIIGVLLIIHLIGQTIISNLVLHCLELMPQI